VTVAAGDCQWPSRSDSGPNFCDPVTVRMYQGAEQDPVGVGRSNPARAVHMPFGHF